MSDLLLPFLQWAGLMAAVLAGFLALDLGLHVVADRLTDRRARDGGR